MTIHTGTTPDPRINQHPMPAGLRERLQAEHGWSAEFTQGAEREYRRFLYLAAYGGQSVTPSQTVDEVWHTHLMFTRDYWGPFQNVLPAPLHHDPGTGAPGDEQKFQDQYLRTLDLYETVFGETPAPTYWPRFGTYEQPDSRNEPVKRRAALGRTLLPLLLILGGITLCILMIRALGVTGMAASGFLGMGAAIFALTSLAQRSQLGTTPGSGARRRDRDDSSGSSCGGFSDSSGSDGGSCSGGSDGGASSCGGSSCGGGGCGGGGCGS
ncbi:glycine-rich domain-containing protein [Deinococcus hopiensis]|uniref:TIGR04222 domain-containing protein n=1 Tax=Deinococcus hopiensis KR-140 TaxID=695939 RepID=A0A1W1UYC7_9DEIO|nr:hypothetical protein [Deinococcus hopiensis]SMB86108.1 hypothetical protein SAMN00790413_03688 [Deinococcus hopiensis KR-140]